MRVLVLNSGSSSLKCKLFNLSNKEVIYEKHIENIGEIGESIKNHYEALESLEIDFDKIELVGHRVVHGGEYFKEATIIDEKVIEKIQKLIPLAPLHNASNLEGIHLVKKKLPNVIQVAVFDTAFHSTMDESSFMYALPMEMYKKHAIRRYGFHGTSHSFLMKEASKILNIDIDNINLITLHLGNGSSACAIKNGKSIDTSMGFTPLEGLVMGSRSGDIDPSIVLYMQRELDFSVNEVDNILNKKSGLVGICNENDVRKILLSQDDDSKLALKMMIRRIQKYIGAYLAVLDNVDAIVFSGGIGENSSYIKDEVLKSKIFENIKSLVIKTDEELEIANECFRVLKK